MSPHILAEIHILFVIVVVGNDPNRLEIRHFGPSRRLARHTQQFTATVLRGGSRPPRIESITS